MTLTFVVTSTLLGGAVAVSSRLSSLEEKVGWILQRLERLEEPPRR